MKTHLVLLLAAAGLLQLPVNADDLHVRVGSVIDMRNSAGIGNLRIELRLLGDSALQARAARASVTAAEDDTGAELDPAEGVPSNGFTQFGSSIAGGLSNGFYNSFDQRRVVSVSLVNPARAAKSLQSVTGKIEVFIPDNDPDSAIIVPGILAKLGVAVVSPALVQVGATAIPYDKAGFEKARADGDIEWNIARGDAVRQGDLILALTDPHHRVMLAEFQTLDGEPLQTMGRTSSTSSGGLITAYHFAGKVPADIRFACYVLTPKSVVTLPFKLTNIPLP